MKGDDVTESLRWRALNGKRVAELLRQPEALANALQPPKTGKEASKSFPAGLQTAWDHDGPKEISRSHRASSSAQVAARLCNGSEEPDAPDGSCNPRKLELYLRRNSSGRIHDIIHSSESAQEAPGTLSVYGTKSFFVDSSRFGTGQTLKRHIVPPGSRRVGEIWEHHFVGADSPSADGNGGCCGRKARSAFSGVQHDMRGIIHHSYVEEDVPARRPQHRSSHLLAAENPCRWGVDVLNYQLPAQRRIRGIATEENLGSGLMPKWSFDERPSASKRATSSLCPYRVDHLEPSTLYPLASASQKFVQRKKKKEFKKDSLDQTCTPYTDEACPSIGRLTTSRLQSHLQAGLVPCVEDQSTRKRWNERMNMGSLQRDLTPQASSGERTTHRHQAVRLRGCLQSGSLMPL